MLSSEIFFGNRSIQIMSHLFVQETNRFTPQGEIFVIDHLIIIISRKISVLEKNFLTYSRFLKYIRRAFISSNEQRDYQCKH